MSRDLSGADGRPDPSDAPGSPHCAGPSRRRARVEYSPRVARWASGHDRVRCRGLERNVQRLAPLPDFLNLTITRPHLPRHGVSVSGVCRVGPAGAEAEAIPPRKRAFGAFGPQETAGTAGKRERPQPKPSKSEVP